MVSINMSSYAQNLDESHTVYTFRQLMELVLEHTNRRRLIISFPFSFGYIQGAILELLPRNLFTVTRAQVKNTPVSTDNALTNHNSRHYQIEQLQKDNIVTEGSHLPFKKLIEEGYGHSVLESLLYRLPQYLR